MNKRLLLISPYFPPHGVVGEKRALNMVNYLPAHGWEVIVLASPPHFQEKEVSSFHEDSTTTVNYGFITPWLRPIINLFTSKPGSSTSVKPDLSKKPSKSLTPLDQYMWDIPGAIKAGKALIRKHKPDVILVNADPWSGLLVGHRLSQWSGIPWVADLRDPWTVFEEKMALRPRVIQRWIHRLEKTFFHSAAHVILNTRSCKERYTEVYPASVSAKFRFVRNAFDQSLYDPATSDAGKDQVYRFGYFGSFRKFVSPESLLKAFALFVQKYDHSPNEVRLVMTGSPNSEFMYYLNELKLQSFCDIQPAVEVSQTIKVLKSWDVLLLVVSNYYQWMVPAKLYDYMAAQKPILALSANTEVNEIIKETKSGFVCQPDDIEQIADQMEYLFQSRLNDLDNHGPIEEYSVTAQVQKMNQILTQVLPDHSK
ncbi:glycosyltransferase [Marinoscillum sp.]|uniref:glycosyltransferase n=1 Tax=Marinoscillum sp. TaxID=2024838 RepID=UPI003BAC35AF